MKTRYPLFVIVILCGLTLSAGAQEEFRKTGTTGYRPGRRTAKRRK